MTVKYAHTNLVARDWKRLVQFYMEVFECEPVYPERDHSGEWLDRLTNLQNARIRGMHLRLPGFDEGPTLEIYEYHQLEEGQELPPANRPGFAHIAFLVDEVEFYLRKLFDNGGSTVGEKVQHEVEGVGTLTVVYARDPEGNIVEIQSWH